MSKKILISFLIMFGAAAYAEEATTKYSVVVDSGSSGNRVFVYSITPDKYNHPIIKEEYTATNKNALATYSQDSKKDPSSADTIVPLTENAKKSPSLAGTEAIVPLLVDAKDNFFIKNHIAVTTPIEVSILATAGMRTLSDDMQIDIYKNVKEAVNTDKFFKVVNAKTIYGKDEGLYGWLGANYSHRNLAPGKKTTGIVEVGGASAQIVFNAPSLKEIPEEFKKQDAEITKFTLNGTDYNVFSISYLGLGQNMARDDMKMHSADKGISCYPNDNDDDLGKSMNYEFSACATNYTNLLSMPEYSSLNKIHMIHEFNKTRFYALGALSYVTFGFLGFDIDNADTGTTKSKWKKRLISRCEKSDKYMPNQCANDTYKYNSKWEKSLISKCEELDKPSANQCANATFQYALLYGDKDDQNSLHLAETGQLKPRLKINGVSASWTLGYIVSQSAISRDGKPQ